MKIIFIMISVLSLIVLSSCASDEIEPISTDEQIELTLEELALFDGKNGNKGYVAVNGVIYDVSNSSLWPNGSHNGFQAGQDLTVPIMSSPHGFSTLSRLPIVGALVTE